MRERRQGRAALRRRACEEFEGFNSLFEQLVSSMEDGSQASNRLQEHTLHFWDAHFTPTLDNMDSDIGKISSRHRQLFLALVDELSQSSPFSLANLSTSDSMRTTVRNETISIRTDFTHDQSMCPRRSASPSHSFLHCCFGSAESLHERSSSRSALSVVPNIVHVRGILTHPISLTEEMTGIDTTGSRALVREYVPSRMEPGLTQFRFRKPYS